ncbi:hypothetical protein Q5P01_013881 [Channa striata]|uniref:Centromere protein J n=1 Tax=Channa striata TaxID=64152 RepID=A0AA88MLB2_CHASR|nr:hypothetical protein Q5P01_013881 [Channa striata]
MAADFETFVCYVHLTGHFTSRTPPRSHFTGISEPWLSLRGHHVISSRASVLPGRLFRSVDAKYRQSRDSSCLAGYGFARPPGGEGFGPDSPVNGVCSVPRVSDGQLESLHELETKSPHMPLMMKLEQLRQWQQHMQEQLKAHQLEELLCLQDEQKRLLGMMNASQHCTGDHTESPGLSEAEWEDDAIRRSSNHQQSPHVSTSNVCRVPQGPPCGFSQEHHLSGGQEPISRVQDHEEVDDEEETVWNSRGDVQEQDVDTSHFLDPNDTLRPSNGVVMSKDNRKEDNFYDRPIKPGIDGQRQTFQELLEEQLKLEEQRLKSAQQEQSQYGTQAVPKRAFLRRGEGLSRFNKTCKANLPKTEVKKDSKQQPQARVISRSNSEPANIQKGGFQRLPVHRKTAVLNKENQLRGPSSSSPDTSDGGKSSRTKVLGSHQRQNTDEPDAVQRDPGNRQIKQQMGQGKEPVQRKVGPFTQTIRKPGLHNMQPNPVTKQVGFLVRPEEAEQDTAKEEICISEVETAEGSTASVGEEVPQDLFELSFQEKLHRWECDRQLENMELGEFELLELAAEELSFSSNSSFVTKILHMDQQHRQLQAARGLHQRRLSSTPIKSPPTGALKRCNSVGSSGGLARRGTGVISEAFVVTRRDEILQNKVSLEDKEGQGNERENQKMSEYEDQKVAVKPPLFPSTLCFPSQPNPPYDKSSYQDEDSFRDPDSDVTQEDDGETGSVLSNTDESTIVEDKNGQQGQVVFDDDDTWNDLDDIPVALPSDSTGVSPVSKATANGVSPPERTLLRKVAATKVVELEKAKAFSSANLEPDSPPPASKLMTRLFPSLKPRTQNAPAPPPPDPIAASAAPEVKKAEEETVQQAQSRLLRERLVELEIEIERFKKENAALAKLRQENEKKQETLRKEHLEFEQMKAEELAKFEEYKKEENRKLQKERKLFEKHALAARAIPDKKEREEIQVLKQQLSSLQEELKKKESRWASTHSRLRQQIDSLSQESSSLRDEVRMLEKIRLSAWKRSAEKDRDMKDAPKAFENSLSSVTKGVKFATPLDSRGSSSSSSSSSSPPNRGGTRENLQGSIGMKSSLRKPAGPGSSSLYCSLPGRRTEERPAPADKIQDEPSGNCSPIRDKRELPKEAECSDASDEPEAAQEVITHPDGKVEKVLAGGDRLVVFPNGTRKEVSADGLTVKVTFFNGDTKEITADQRVIYYYAEAQTTHITYPDGMEVLHFPNNQTEKHFPDGRKEITFPDQTVKNLFPDGREESVLTDGTIIRVNLDGTKEILFNTGQKEIHTADFKRREYPDGTVKTVYTDGRQETRYPNGRLRIKDKDGNITLDNRA